MREWQLKTGKTYEPTPALSKPASHTGATYVQQISMFARHFDQSPETLGPEAIRSYQVYLAMEKELAPSSISTAVAALRFLYNVNVNLQRRNSDHERVCPSYSHRRHGGAIRSGHLFLP
jgi:site-specific recombinase XerD